MIGLRAQPRSIVVEADPEFTFSGGPMYLLTIRDGLNTRHVGPYLGPSEEGQTSCTGMDMSSFWR